MNNTPRGNRKHVVLYGKTNSGKSSLFNKLCNSNISIVSEIEGTTTDPVSKGVEFIPVGPVLYIDT
ncbi:MAG: GTPase, partial [Clostridium paraputrificum]